LGTPEECERLDKDLKRRLEHLARRMGYRPGVEGGPWIPPAADRPDIPDAPS
jgi:hypothetical protein